MRTRLADLLGLKDLEPWSRLLHYEVLDVLPSSALTALHRAINNTNRELVVLKTAATGVSEGEGVLRQEGQLLLTLRHPGVIELVDCARAIEPPFVITKWLDGSSLEMALNRSRPSEAILAAVGAAVADTLVFLRSRGVVHRDLKPENLEITRDGRVVLLDFDIATASGTSAQVRGQDAIGTPLFISPEQLTPGAALASPTDVYGLGITLYYAMSGCLPYRGSDWTELHAAILNKSPVPLERLVDADPRFTTLINAMLVKDPAKRPPPDVIAGEFATLAATKVEVGKWANSEE